MKKYLIITLTILNYSSLDAHSHDKKIWTYEDVEQHLEHNKTKDIIAQNTSEEKTHNYTYEDVEHLLNFNKNNIKQAAETELILLKKHINYIYDYIKSTGSLHKLKKDIKNIINNNNKLIKYTNHSNPVDKSTLNTIHNFMQNAIFEISLLAKEGRAIIKEERSLVEFYSLLDIYFNAIILKLALSNIKIQENTILTKPKESKDYFYILKNILKQNQCDKMKLYIDNLFTKNNTNK